jgi:hypothetical protein
MAGLENHALCVAKSLNGSHSRRVRLFIALSVSDEEELIVIASGAWQSLLASNAPA